VRQPPPAKEKNTAEGMRSTCPHRQAHGETTTACDRKSTAEGMRSTRRIYAIKNLRLRKRIVPVALLARIGCGTRARPLITRSGSAPTFPVAGVRGALGMMPMPGKGADDSAHPGSSLIGSSFFARAAIDPSNVIILFNIAIVFPCLAKGACC